MSSCVRSPATTLRASRYSSPRSRCAWREMYASITVSSLCRAGVVQEPRLSRIATMIESEFMQVIQSAISLVQLVRYNCRDGNMHGVAYFGGHDARLSFESGRVDCNFVCVLPGDYLARSDGPGVAARFVYV